MAKPGDLFSIVKNWNEKLQKCSFASEIYLDPEQLDYFAGEFKRVMLLNKSNLQGVAALVLAVNCAYHYYDDRGFWYHFCRILDIVQTPAVEEKFGGLIEKQLYKYGLNKTKRAGPFRYVGAILEQCGVSKKYITPFANIIKDLKKARPWDALLSIRRMEFLQHVDMFYSSHYLKNFLKDEAGRDFTMQVCQLLWYYEQGKLDKDDFRELSGYQTGFWDEFLASFYGNKQGSAGVRVSAMLKPRLVFVPEEGCLAIRFPGQEYANGVKYPALPGFWKYPLTMLKQERALSDYYTGLIPDPSGREVEWMLSGWVPDGMPALFHTVSGFVRQGNGFNPGQYWLLVPGDYKPSCHVISEAKQVALPGNIDYRAFYVLLNLGDDLQGYEAGEDPFIEIVLEWDDPEKYRLWCGEPGLDIFLGSLPNLVISNFQPIEEQKVAFFYVAGSVSGRVKNRQELGELLAEINNMAPVTGHFSICAIGRTGTPNYGSVLSEVDFSLMPPLNIKFERRLYDFDGEPFVEIDDNFPGRLQLESCRREDPEGRKWVVPAAVDLVRGSLKCEDLIVNIKIPVYRTRLYDSDGKPVRYFFIGDLKQETVFLLTGYPDSEASLGFGKDPVSKMQVKFGSDGLVKITASCLKELFFKGGYSAGEITLTPLNNTGVKHTAGTGAVMIDPEIVFKDITAGRGCLPAICTARYLITILDMCCELCRGVKKGKRYSLTRFPRFHSDLDEQIFTIFACATVFDGAVILINGKRTDWTDQIKNKKFCRLLRFIIQARTGILPGELPPPIDKMILPVERWMSGLNKYYGIYTAGPVFPDISSWAKEILRHQKIFRSNIADLPGGHSLSTAWVLYHRKSYARALILLNRIKNVPLLILDLQVFLRILLLLRLARLQTAEKACRDGQSSKNLRFFLLPGQVVKILKRKETVLLVEPLVDFLNSLPLRKEDSVLLKAAASGYSKKDRISVFPDSQDWLLLLLLINVCKNPQCKSELTDKLIKLENTIPLSPDKQDIIEQLKFIP